MEFATLDKMVIELEKEKEVLDNRIADIKECILKMKEAYRNETMPEVGEMVDYLLERARKRLGDTIVEASDISEEILDDFYEVTERKVDVKRIVLGYKNIDRIGYFWFFFTDKELYLWSRDRNYSHGYSVYPYKAIKDLDCKCFFSVKTITIDVEENECIRHDWVNLYEVLNFAIEKEDAICRLLLDLRDFAIKNI